MNEKRLKRYISNLATAECFAYDISDNFYFDMNKCRKFFLQALRNYCKLRLDLLSKPEVIQVERAIATAAVKAGIKYAVSHYNIELGTNNIDEIVDKIMPSILEDIHELRCDIFTEILGLCGV